MIQSLVLTKSALKTKGGLSTSRLQPSNKPTSSKTKQNRVVNISTTQRTSPMSKSALVQNKLNRSTINSPKVLKQSSSNISLNKTHSPSNLNLSQFRHKPTASSVSQFSARPVTKITMKSSVTPKPSTNRSMIKSQILSRSKITSPTAKSTIIKSRVISKPSIPSFARKPTTQQAKTGSKITNSKASPKMQVIKQEPNNQVLYPLQIQQLEGKVKCLIVQNSKHMLEIDCLKLELFDRNAQIAELEEQIIRRQGEKMVQMLGARIISHEDRLIQIEVQAIQKVGKKNEEKARKLQVTVQQKDRDIDQLQAKIKDYQNQLILITEELKQVEKSTIQLFDEKAELQKRSSEFSQNNSFLNQSIVMRDGEVTELKSSILQLTKGWESKYKNLQDELEHSKLQYQKKQRDLEATRMILEEERGKSFHANQQLMTMFTETDVRNQEEIERLNIKVQQLEEHLRSYQDILQKMERDLDSDEKRKQDFQRTRDSQMDSLEELLGKIKEEGKEFLRAREDEIERREYKRMGQMKSSIR